MCSTPTPEQAAKPICSRCGALLDVELIDDFLAGKSRDCRCSNPECGFRERLPGWKEESAAE